MQQKNKKLKIVFFTTDFPPTVGGISEFTHSLSFYMAQSPSVTYVSVVALKNQEKGEEYENEKLLIIRDDKKSFAAIFFSICYYAFKYRKYDVFHATHVFPMGFLAVLIGRYIFRKPVFVTFHGTDILERRGSGKTRFAKEWTLRHATRAIAVSNSTRNEIIKRYGILASQLSVIYYPLRDTPPEVSQDDARTIREKYKITPADFLVLYVGHLVKRKGGEYLIQAIANIKNFHIKLMFVGDGPERKNFETLARSLGATDLVIFAGKVPDVSVFYNISNLFSMPSFFYTEEGDIEGLGIAYLEAQQYGVPVLGTHSGGIPEAVEDGKSGFLVQERDSRALAEKIVFLYNNPIVRKKMGERAKLFVREKFNWRKSTERHITMYHSFQ
ncbi:MAG: glycosyltransferase family 4 protein [Parcubacteria group bacterium]|nr:glycosyltransferase family 4 protein [Parcubacteria group bacterium]